jgi:hypothetical protein
MGKSEYGKGLKEMNADGGGEKARVAVVLIVIIGLVFS